MRRMVGVSAAAVALVTLSCAGPKGGAAPSSGGAGAAAAAPFDRSMTAPEVALQTPPPALSPLATLITDAESARYDAAFHVEPIAPTTLSIPALRVADAAVIPVGLDGNDELDVPGADLVGWYRYGPVPGAPGAAVLASHVEYNHVPGVFRYLTKVKEGDLLTVGYADGSTRRFRVTETSTYGKSELPERVWRRSGEAALVLVTCGGTYNRALQSYESNVVVYAAPV